jgi:selenocysteine-specific elongation factor
VEIRHAILATAGHVDHGKSSLVIALTGTDPDRLPEEKARGITIELGFAHLSLPGRGVEYSLGVVDVPGHEDFVRNMVAGVGSIDVALLVVAANEGWMPQTEEHLQILLYLGVTRAVVALTKTDLVPDPAGAVAAVRDKLRGTPLAEAAIVPTSVTTGEGLARLRATLADVLTGAAPSPDAGKPRLPLDRVFTLRGVGTVGTGTLAGGSLAAGQAVVVQPAGLAARVRTLHSHNREIDVARPGSRVAVNLPGLHPRGADDARDDSVIGRGDVVTTAGLGPGTRTLDVLLWRSARKTPGAPPQRALKDLTQVHVHHASTAVQARVRLLEGADLPPGGHALAQLRLARPLFALAGDRLVLRDGSEQHTIAGGIVLDPDATREDVRDPARLAFLTARAAAPDDPAAFVASHLRRFHVARRAALLVRSRFAPAEVEAAAAGRIASGDALVLGEWFVGRAWWDAQLVRAGEAVDAHHRASPEQVGLPVTDLLPAVERGASADEREMLRASLLDAMVGGDFVRAATRVRRAAHRPRLPAHLRADGDRMRDVLARHPFDPPSKKELLGPSSTSLPALKFLVINGEAVELGPDQVIGAAALARAAEIVRAHLTRHGAATVAELKTALGSNRRIAVPLLERLDHDGVTSRQGDRRVLRTPPV